MSVVVWSKVAPEIWKDNLSKKLVEVFGKDTFNEDELEKEFWVELKIRCGDFFKTADGSFDMDLFWSDKFREWLISSKK